MLEVGSTTEFYATDGDYALLMAEYLKEREAVLKNLENTPKY